MGRFINADTLVATGRGILGYNMFSYCNNNSVRFMDSNGCEPTEAVDTDGDGEPDYYRYDYSYTYYEFAGFLILEREITGSVYIFPDIGSTSNLDASDIPMGFNPRYDLMVGYYVDKSEDHDNPVMYAYQAHQVAKCAMDPIVDVMLQYDKDFNTDWSRTAHSLYHEWECHNEFSIAESAQNIDFDNDEEGKTRIYFYGKAIKRFLGIE